MGEIVRLGRYLNILLGLALVVIPWIAGDGNTGLYITSSIAGLIVAALALPRGPKTETYCMWDKYVR